MGLFLVIFFGVFCLFMLFIVYKINQSENSRAKQSGKNLAIMHRTGHQPPHTKWDEDGYLIDD